MIFLVAVCILLIRSVAGEDFVLVFMEHEVVGSDVDLSVTVMNPSNFSVEVTIDFVNMPMPNDNCTLAANDFCTVTVHPNATLFKAVKHTKYINISGDGAISVYADTTLTGPFATSGFLVLPVSSLTSKYLIATDCVNGKCIFAVTSTADGNEITANFRISGGQATYEDKTFSDNDMLKESLNTGETLQVTCDSCDMTGTLVTATKPVAVFSGAEFTEGRAKYSSVRDAVAEQMDPMETLGDKYTLLSRDSFPTVQGVVKVVLLQTGDSCTINDTTYTASRDRDVLVLLTNGIMDIAGSAQLFVAQFVISEMYGIGISLILPTPWHQWKTGYDIYTPTSGRDLFFYMDSALSMWLLLPNGTDPDWIHLSGDEVAPVTIFPEGNYTVLWYEFRRMYRRSVLYHVQCMNPACQPFSGFVIQNKHFDSSAGYFLPGKGLYIIEQTTQNDVTTTMLQTTPYSTHTQTTGEMTPPAAVTTANSVAETQTPKSSSTQRPCICVKNATLSNNVLGERSVEQVNAEIKANLTEDRKKLSSYTRTKMSTVDPRQSSSLLGTTFGLSIIVFFAAFFCLSDMITLVKCLTDKPESKQEQAVTDENRDSESKKKRVKFDNEK